MTRDTGRAFVFGDNVDTDALAPGLYMKKPIEEMARHTLEALDPSFADSVRAGDVVVGGDNFGMGSSREQAVMTLRTLGVAAVTGDLDDIHSAMIASTRAAVTLELVAAVRNKGVDAFNEIMRMQA